MKMLKIILALIMSAAVISLQGMVCYKHLVTPDNKHIFLSGQLVERAMGADKTGPFFSLLDYIKAVPLKQPLPFIVEHGNFDIHGTGPQVPYTFGKLLALQAEKDRGTQKQIDLEFYDPRGKAAEMLIRCLGDVARRMVTDLPQDFLKYYSDDQLDQYTGSTALNDLYWRALCDSVKKLIKVGPGTLKDYREYL